MGTTEESIERLWEAIDLIGTRLYELEEKIKELKK